LRQRGRDARRSSLPPIQPVGWPLPDTQALIVAPNGRLCGVGERGEIVIRTPCRTLGYLHASDDEPRRFAVNPHRRDPQDVVYWTGDCGAYRPDGAIEIRGRLDDQIKIRGIRIEPQGVSASLARHPHVQSCTVIAERSAGGDMTLLAYVVPDASGATSDDLRRYLARQLPAAMVPSHVFLLDRLPLTANGKIDRRALPRPELDEWRARAEPTPPRTPIEDRLATIWMRLLALEQVGVDDDFFALGGHSLLATELIFQVRRTLGCELPLRQLFDTPTIAGLAAALDGRTSEAGASSLPPLPALVPDLPGRHEPFALTDIQQAYWVGRTSDFALGNVATHNYTEFQFPDLDVDRLAAALNRLIDRHDMLRAIVTSDGRQRILPRVAPYAIATIDLRQADAAAQAESLQRVRERLTHQVLPLDAWPLFEVMVSRLPGGDAILHVSIDALICDAWSRRLLGRELLQMYRDPAIELPPLAITFRDYVLTEAALHDHDLYRRAEAYWLGRIVQLPPAPELPLACSPDALPQPRFVRQRGRLEAGAWGRLKARAARSGLTPSGLLCAVYAEVVGAWSASPRFTLNLTLFNRLPLHAQVARLVGDFTSLTLLAIDRAAGPSFEARARAIQAQLWEDLDHRHFSGVRVLRELHRRRGGPRGALMPVVLTSALFDDSTGDADELRTWHREHRYGISQTPQAFLDHGVSEQAGALVYTWDAVADLFPPNVLAAMFTAYGELLTALAEAGEAWTRRASGPPLPVAQRDVRAAMNATATPFAAAALHADVVRQIADRPAAIAVAMSGRTLSYATLGAEAAAITGALRARGVGAELVAVVMEKGWEQVVAVLGILEAGAAYLPIDAGWPQARQWAVLQRGQVRVAVTQPAVEARAIWPAGVDRLVVRAGSTADDPLTGACVSPAALAYVIFTSGSTGEPKGVVVDHAAALNTVRDVTARWAIGRGSSRCSAVRDPKRCGS
jgi:non-ribosomal peptide synthetase component F/acyl carrier protein